MSHDRSPSHHGVFSKESETPRTTCAHPAGAVTLIQRFGGSLNLNVHYHMLFLEGGTTKQGRGRNSAERFPSDEDVQALVFTIATRVIRFFQKKGYFQDDVDSAVPEKDWRKKRLCRRSRLLPFNPGLRWENGKEGMSGVWALSIGNKWNGQAGCARKWRFSLHAAFIANRGNAPNLKCSAATLPPAIAEERLELQPSGDIILRLKTPYSDGTSHLLFSGLSLSRN